MARLATCPVDAVLFDRALFRVIQLRRWKLHSGGSMEQLLLDTEGSASEIPKNRAFPLNFINFIPTLIGP